MIILILFYEHKKNVANGFFRRPKTLIEKY